MSKWVRIRPDGNKYYYDTNIFRGQTFYRQYLTYGDYWYNDYGRHRIDGPALCEYDRSQKLRLIQWFIDGKQIQVSTQEEFESYMKLKAFW
jgi:hypothetical protein